MKRFLLWLIIAAALYGGPSLFYHSYLTQHPRKVAVSLDTSFDMQSVQLQVSRELEKLSSLRYSVFSLLTDKLRIHGWQEDLAANRAISFYGPRNLSALIDASKYPELREADRIVIITNAKSLPGIGRLAHAQVIELKP